MTAPPTPNGDGPSPEYDYEIGDYEAEFVPANPAAPQPGESTDEFKARRLAERKRQTLDARLAGVKFLDVATLLDTAPPETEWLIDGVAARGHLTMLVGPAKVMKSFVMQAAEMVATTGGGSFAGIDVQSAKVLTVDAENGQVLVHKRLHLLAGDVDPQRYLITTARVDLVNDLDVLEALIAEHQPDIVRLDSWRSLWSGNENAAEEAGPCLNALTELAHRYSVAIALLHHMPLEGGRARGSSAIDAAVEHLLTLTPVDGDEGLRVLRNRFCRFDRERADCYVRLVERSNGTLTFEAGAPPETEQERLIAEIRRVLKAGPLRRREIIAALDVEGSGERRVDNALREAVKRGDLLQDGKGMPYAINPDQPGV